MENISLIDVNKPERLQNAINELVEYAKTSGVEKIDGLQEQIVVMDNRVDSVETLAKGANQCKTYNSYADMIAEFNYFDAATFKPGQDIRIVTVDVPDLWVAYVENQPFEYTFVSDEKIVEELKTNGFIQVGYYKLGMLETQKANLTNLVKNTDYATSESAGIGKVEKAMGVGVQDEYFYAVPCNDADIIDEATDNNRTLQGRHTSKIVKQGLISNTQVWTETDKLSARDLLGIKVPKIVVIPEE